MENKSGISSILVLLIITFVAASDLYALTISNAQIQYINCEGFCFQPGLTFTFDRDNTGTGKESNGIKVTDGNGNVLVSAGGASSVPSTTTIPESWCFTYSTAPQRNPITIQLISPAGNGFSNQIAYQTTGICEAIPSLSTSIPTMTEWGMVIMSVLFGGSGIYLLRRRWVV